MNRVVEVALPFSVNSDQSQLQKWQSRIVIKMEVKSSSKRFHSTW